MARYNYIVEHVPGKLLYTADALSRATSRGNDLSDELQYDAESYIASVISNLPSTPDRLEMYRQAQEKDLITRQVIQWCQSECRAFHRNCQQRGIQWGGVWIYGTWSLQTLAADHHRQQLQHESSPTRWQLRAGHCLRVGGHCLCEGIRVTFQTGNLLLVSFLWCLSHNEHNSLHRLKPRKFALPIAFLTSNMLTEDVAPETKDCHLGRFGSGSSGCLVHSELAAVGSKSERISACHTDVAQRIRPISRACDTHMYTLGSRDSAAAIVRDNSAALRLGAAL